MRADTPMLRVLIVDDNRDAADSLARIIKLWGHDAWASYDGPSGLAAAIFYRPDVVLVDVSLPGMDGFQLVRAIRTQPALRGSLLISVSAHDDADLVTRLYDCGINEHLPKPINLIALKALLKRHSGAAQDDPDEPPGSGFLSRPSPASLVF